MQDHVLTTYSRMAVCICVMQVHTNIVIQSSINRTSRRQNEEPTPWTNVLRYLNLYSVTTPPMHLVKDRKQLNAMKATKTF